MSTTLVLFKFLGSRKHQKEASIFKHLFKSNDKVAAQMILCQQGMHLTKQRFTQDLSPVARHLKKALL